MSVLGEDLLSLLDITPLVLCAVGVSIVITGTKAGYPVRLIWCWIWRWRYTRWVWDFMRCPYCNAFWSGLLVGWVMQLPLIQLFQVAITTCGLVRILQVALGGDGIAMVEDFEAFFDKEV